MPRGDKTKAEMAVADGIAPPSNTPSAKRASSGAAPPPRRSVLNEIPKPTQRTGRWTPDEKILFLYGLKRFGKGRWKRMHMYLPHRSLVQIKSHAQKVLKRLDAGEDVFRRLEENLGIIDRLVVDAMKTQLSPAGLQEFNESCRRTASLYSKRKRPTKSSKKAEPQTVSPVNAAESGPVYEAGRGDAESGKESVIAAAALCQLSSIGGWESDKVGASPVEE